MILVRLTGAVDGVTLFINMDHISMMHDEPQGGATLHMPDISMGVTVKETVAQILLLLPADALSNPRRVITGH